MRGLESSVTTTESTTFSSVFLISGFIDSALTVTVRLDIWLVPILLRLSCSGGDTPNDNPAAPITLEINAMNFHYFFSLVGFQFGREGGSLVKSVLGVGGAELAENTLLLNFDDMIYRLYRLQLHWVAIAYPRHFQAQI